MLVWIAIPFRESLSKFKTANSQSRIAAMFLELAANSFQENIKIDDLLETNHPFEREF
jgi:hypothetical protein